MKSLVFSAATVKQGIKALSLVAKEKTKRFFQKAVAAVSRLPKTAREAVKHCFKRLFALVSNPAKIAWKTCIKLQDRILFDGMLALFFIFGSFFIFFVLKITESSSYQNIMGVYDILSALFGAFFILTAMKGLRDGKMILVFTFIFGSFCIFFIMKNTEIALYKNITGIYGVLGALLGALFIFTAAEGLRDRSETYKVRILLDYSKFNTLIFLFLLSLVFLIFPRFKILSLIALIGFILFSMYSSYQILSILLNKKILWEEKLDLFKNRIKKATDFVIYCQEKNKKFLEKINSNEIKFQYAPSPLSFMNLEVLNSTKEGTVIDIDLDGLKSIADKIDKATSDKERERQEDIAEMPKESSKNKQTNASQPQETQKKKETGYNKNQPFFFVCFGQEISEESPVLSFAKDIEIDRNKLQKKLNNIISTEKSPVILETIDYLEELKFTTEQWIKEKNFNQFKRHFDVYLELAKDFLNQLSRKDQLYSYQEAKRDGSADFREISVWPYLSQLIDHAMVFFEKAKNIKKDRDSESKKIYEKIKWLPKRLIVLSQRKEDHLLFQNALFLWQRQFIALSDSSPLNKEDEEDIKKHIDFFREPILFSVFYNEHRTDDHLVFLLEVIKGIFDRGLRRKLYFLLPYLERIIWLVAKKKDSALMADEEYIKENIEEIKYSKINPLVFEKPSSYESRQLQFLFGLGSCLEKTAGQGIGRH